MAGDSTVHRETPVNVVEVSGEAVFLHGELDLWILEAKSLPNMDLATERVRRCFNMGDNSTNKNNDILGAQLIGVVGISVEKLISGNAVSGWFPIVGSQGNPLKPYPELHVSIQFRPVGENPLYKDGVGAGSGYLGVPNTYFPLHKGGSITLYQDAHVPKGMLPEILLDGGKIFQQGQCWEEICHAMLEAHHLIYIIGWSIFHPVKLLREPTKPVPAGGELSLGELLKYKSEEGVRVLMLIWDDKTSHDRLLFKTVMLIHLVVGTLFTHHQKCVLLDTQAPGNNRKITAFIGGLDLCDGRYDTPEHRLFSDLDTVFSNDFHNPTFPHLNTV
ncbi:Phospholipase D delta [Vitis vinifera]|uniref:phospholipase D n=1 Tax=Vitis vinifera TaxID=29760 RepID=A0A438J6U5_VITVI|nr:Phospholipase D delta [Vitis vinifera]